MSMKGVGGEQSGYGVGEKGEQVEYKMRANEI